LIAHQRLSRFGFFNIMSYFIYTALISSLLDPRLVDPPRWCIDPWSITLQRAGKLCIMPCFRLKQLYQ